MELVQQGGAAVPDRAIRAYTARYVYQWRHFPFRGPRSQASLVFAHFGRRTRSSRHAAESLVRRPIPPLALRNLPQIIDRDYRGSEMHRNPASRLLAPADAFVKIRQNRLDRLGVV